MGLVSAIFRNILGKPGAADFRDSAEHFVQVMREHGIGLTWGRDELLFVDDLVARLKGHNEYRDAVGCYLGELLARKPQLTLALPRDALLGASVGAPVHPAERKEVLDAFRRGDADGGTERVGGHPNEVPKSAGQGWRLRRCARQGDCVIDC